MLPLGKLGSCLGRMVREHKNYQTGVPILSKMTKGRGRVVKLINVESLMAKKGIIFHGEKYPAEKLKKNFLIYVIFQW